jgi:predicted dehydrogenase
MIKKQICMIGAGRVGRLHTTNLVQHAGERAEIVAICDPKQETAQKLAADFGVAHTFASLADALDRHELDGAVITTPTFTHCTEAISALRSGLHVHLEKPMAMNLVECRKINEAALAARRSVQLGFMRRFDDDFVAAEELLRSGEAGRPMLIKSLTHGPGLPPAWANDLRTSNGILAEVNSHDLDAVSWFAAAEPVDIHVRAANFKGAERGVVTDNFYDTIVATIGYDSGALAVVSGVCPVDYGYDSRIEVVTTNGLVQVGDTGPGGLSVITAGSGVSRRSVYASWQTRFADAYAREMIEFVAAMDGAPVRVGLSEGTRAVALVLAGTLSLLENRVVPIAEVMRSDAVPSWQRTPMGTH